MLGLTTTVNQIALQIVLAIHLGDFLATLKALGVGTGIATDTGPIEIRLLGCLIQVAHLLRRLRLLERRIFEGLRVGVLNLLLRDRVCLARLEAFKEVVGGELLALRRQHNRRLHR